MAENVEFTISFSDLNTGGKKTANQDTFGINIKYAVPDGSTSLPNSIPLALKGGNIYIKISNDTPPVSPPGGGKKH